ncbi:hypothetical protein CHH49_18115 [Terribacillus saccharophilus]|uniref:hypothetical protein n=1 Tax=Terribacillus saccharophilus TaxID=361277 RepID=UPI000BA59157|nr:hypothetical protein [Terribacillus saccharophilus]PAF20062.1 hypothetical protein CHH49_18115 [Terribacillus saccharophilus]
MPGDKITFWSNASMGDFWGFVRMLLSGISPGIMITVAAAAAGMILALAVRIFYWARKENEREDEDVEYRTY